MVCPALLLQSFIWISLMAKGVQCDVTHIVSRMCVVQQSTVLIPCKHTSQHEQVSAAEWLFEKPSGQRVRVSQDPVFAGRVEFVQPAVRNCSLLLRDVRKSDAGIFRFVLSTASGRNWTNDRGIQLEVTDAELEVKTESDGVMEGDMIMLVCGSCIPSMTVPTYIWRKDGHLHSQHHGDNILVLESVELEDRGRYSCTISGHERLNSTSAEITVRPGYPPKSVSVSISASGEIVEGDSVTLSCSSDSNPPALIFSWFKENQSSAVGSGQSFIISSFNSSHSGRYYCEAQNQHGSQRSASVSVSVKGAQRAALHTVTGIVAGCGALIIIIVIIVIIVFIKKKGRDGGANVVRQNQQDDRVGRSEETAPTNDVPVYSLESANQGDDLYTNIKVKKPKRSGREQTEKDSEDIEEIQYASVHHFKNKDMNKTEETIEMPHPSDANRSEDVIYSSVK